MSLEAEGAGRADGLGGRARGAAPEVRRRLGLAAAAALVVAGALSFPRLDIQASRQAGFPEITVSSSAPPVASPVDTGRSALGPDSPLLREIRALGGVTGVAGEARTGGAEIHVRFAAGADPEVKALRLSRALAASAPGAFSVRPGRRAEGDLAAILWLGSLGDGASRDLAEELRSVPGVRSVDRHGGTGEQIRYRLPLPPGRETDAIARGVARSLEAVPLGRTRSGSADGEGVRVAPPEGGFADLVLPGNVRLGTLAERRTHREPLPAQTHLRGRPGRALWVWRESDAPPLRLSGDLRRKLRELSLPGDTRLLFDEAAPLRRELGRFAAGLALAALLLGVGAWRLGGGRAAPAALLLPLAAAGAAIVALRACGTRLDPSSLPAVLLAAGAAAVAGLLAEALRGLPRRRFLAIAGASALALPLAAWLGQAVVPPLLAASCRVFGIAAAAGLSAAALLGAIGGAGRPGTGPRPPRRTRGGGPFPAGSRGGRVGRALRLVLREPETALLAAASAGFLLFVYFGGALAPRAAGSPSGEGGDADLTLLIDAPAGSTLRETEALVGWIERGLDELGGKSRIAEHWSDFDASRARIALRLTPEGRGAPERQELIAGLRFRLPGGEALRVEGAGGSGGGELWADGELEERAASDRAGESYRALLHAADLETLRQAVGRVRGRLRESKVPLRSIRIDEALPSTFLDLSPQGAGSAALAAAVASRLAQRSSPPPPLPLAGPDERTLVLLPAGAPADREAVPQRAALLGRALEVDDPATGAALAVVPSALYRVAERSAPSRAAWQSGRFLQAVEIDLREIPSREGREKRRLELDRAFASLRLPLGSHLERPDLSWLGLRRRELRRALLLLLLPLLWLAAGTVRLDSLRSGLALLGPAALGAAAAAPVVWAAVASGEGAGEPVLFALAASLAATLPLSAWAAGASADRRGRPGAQAGAYRELRGRAPLALLSALAFALLALVPTLGADPAREAWVVPLRAAAAAGGVSAASFLLLPALLFAPARRRRGGGGGSPPSPLGIGGDGAAGEGAADPSPAAPRALAVENLTKVYPGGGRALRRVSFELRPGIVGLLGPNGAGKTTLLRCLVGLLEPTRGRVLVGGRPLPSLDRAAYRRGVGFLPQDFNAYPGFTAERFLAYWAAARDLPAGAGRGEEIARLLEAVALTEHARRKVRDFSGGMRRRLGIAAALLGAPPILIVDEPTTGLDIESRARFRETLLAVASERIVLLSTHIASDVEAIASRLLVLSQGRLVFDGTPASLIDQARGAVFETVIPDSELRDLSHRYQLTSRVRLLAGIRVRGVVKPGEPLPGAAVEPTLEEAYLAGQKAAGGGTA